LLLPLQPLLPRLVQLALHIVGDALCHCDGVPRHRVHVVVYSCLESAWVRRERLEVKLHDDWCFAAG
jgi:hypothetical protein